MLQISISFKASSGSPWLVRGGMRRSSAPAHIVESTGSGERESDVPLKDIVQYAADERLGQISFIERPRGTYTVVYADREFIAGVAEADAHEQGEFDALSL